MESAISRIGAAKETVVDGERSTIFAPTYQTTDILAIVAGVNAAAKDTVGQRECGGFHLSDNASAITNAGIDIDCYMASADGIGTAIGVGYQACLGTAVAADRALNGQVLDGGTADIAERSILISCDTDGQRFPVAIEHTAVEVAAGGAHRRRYGRLCRTDVGRQLHIHAAGPVGAFVIHIGERGIVGGILYQIGVALSA